MMFFADNFFVDGEGEEEDVEEIIVIVTETTK